MKTLPRTQQIFWSRIPAWPRRILLAFLLLAVFAPLLANRDPLVVSRNGLLTFPAFSSSPYTTLQEKNGQSRRVRKDNIDWRNLDAGFEVFAPVPYDALSSDGMNANFCSPFASQQMITADGAVKPLPFRYRHWLGTTRTGADVLAGVIHGTRTSLTIGFVSILLAGLIGIFMGALAGYFGNSKLIVHRGTAILFFLALVPAWFYASQVSGHFWGDSFSNPLHYIAGLFLFLLFIFLFLLPRLLLNKYAWFSQSTFVPADMIISRLIEIFISFPRLILILTLSLLTGPSLPALILIIGLTSWMEIARFTRADFLRVRGAAFIDAARSQGMPDKQIIFRHILPNAMTTVSVMLVLGIAGAILAEAGLSFLGIGVPQDCVSWGTLLYSSRTDFSAWWVVVFPGLAISILLWALNTLAEDIRRNSGHQKQNFLNKN